MTDKATIPTNDKFVDVPIDAWERSEFNIRTEHKAGDIEEMAASIKEQGVLNAPVVVRKGRKYQVIAGLLRFLGAEEAELASLTCKDKTGADRAELTAISMAENITRVPMTDLQLFEAFDKLFRLGKPIEAIAQMFVMTDKQVRQKLAIGGLPNKILELARKGDISDDALEALTLASAEQLERYAKMPASRRPYPYELRDWIHGKKGVIPAGHALFDLEQYDGGMKSDLFDPKEEIQLTDIDQFWKLQNAEIERLVEKYEARGWTVEKIDEWYQWQFKKCKKADGGKVFYVVKETGSVSWYDGYARIGTGQSSSSSSGSGKPKAKPELSQAFQFYLREIRHAAAMDAIIDNVDVALASSIACMLTSPGNWRIEDPRNLQMQRVRNEKQLAALDANPHRVAVVEAYQSMRKDLNVKGGQRILRDDPMLFSEDVGKIVRALLQFDRADLLYFHAVTFAYVTGSGWDNRLTYAVAEACELERVDEFDVADPVFWSGIQHKPTLEAIAGELGADPGDATMSALRKTLAKLVPPSWRPRWLQFPGEYYGKKAPDPDKLLRRQ